MVVAEVGAVDFVEELVLRAEGKAPDAGVEVVLSVDAAEG